MSELYHYGVPHGKGPTGRGSGRYPWGSGKDPKQSAQRKGKFKQTAMNVASTAAIDSLILIGPGHFLTVPATVKAVELGTIAVIDAIAALRNKKVKDVKKEKVTEAYHYIKIGENVSEEEFLNMFKTDNPEEEARNILNNDPNIQKLLKKK